MGAGGGRDGGGRRGGGGGGGGGGRCWGVANFGFRGSATTTTATHHARGVPRELERPPRGARPNGQGHVRLCTGASVRPSKGGTRQTPGGADALDVARRKLKDRESELFSPPSKRPAKNSATQPPAKRQKTVEPLSLSDA
eukprot:COSAG01_NODE_12298_length_1764_cov_1.436637_2_plen_140_part_00